MSSIPPTDDHSVWDEGNFVPELHDSLEAPITDSDTVSYAAPAKGAGGGMPSGLPSGMPSPLAAAATGGQ